MTSGPEYIA